MNALLKTMGSMHVAMGALLLLLLSLLLGPSRPGAPGTGFAATLVILAVNLVAAVIVRPQFRRQPALLAFHTCLAATAALLAVQTVTRFEGRIELAENQAFDVSQVEVQSKGRWHDNELGQVEFVQGPISVEYLPDLRRGKTLSVILGGEGSGALQRLGDTRPLLDSGYRFTVTPNKGFALSLSWMDDAGTTLSGNLHMPSYPAREWEQEQAWQTPSGEIVRLSVERSAAPSDRSWVLDRSAFDGRVWLLDSTGRRQALHPGVPVEVSGGRVRLDEVVMWIGYRVESRGLLVWVFAAALLGLIALGWHFWRRPPRYQEPGRSMHAA